MDVDPSLPWRVAAGIAVLVSLAYLDLRKRRRAATRWKEYAFLAATAAAAVLYAELHDVVTSRLSPEYFIVGKGIQDTGEGFGRAVAWLAARAGWSAGLCVGLAFVVANNPTRRGTPQLGYPVLAGHLVVPLGASAAIAALLGVFVWLAHEAVSDLTGVDALGLQAPRAFVSVWAVHAGTYAGAIGGTIGAVYRIRRARRALDRPTSRTPAEAGSR